MTEDQLRDKDQAVLLAIQNGEDDVQRITAATILENHEVNYSLNKLQQLDFVQVKKPDGYVQRTIDGQKRVFQHPKTAELTEQGREALEQQSQDLEGYENLTHQELVKKVHRLEAKIEKLQGSLEAFRRQVQEHL